MVIRWSSDGHQMVIGSWPDGHQVNDQPITRNYYQMTRNYYLITCDYSDYSDYLRDELARLVNERRERRVPAI